MTAAFNAMMAPPGESIDGTEQDEAAAAASAKRAERDRPVIALITAVGSIVTGKGAVGELQQVGNCMGGFFPTTYGLLNHLHCARSDLQRGSGGDWKRCIGLYEGML